MQCEVRGLVEQAAVQRFGRALQLLNRRNETTDHGAFRVSYAEVRIDDPNPPKPPTCVEWKGRPQAQAPMSLRSAAIRQAA